MNDTTISPPLKAFLDASLKAPPKSICIYYELADQIPIAWKQAGRYCEPDNMAWNTNDQGYFILHNGTRVMFQHLSNQPLGQSIAVIGGRYPDEYKAFLHPKTGVAV